MRGSARLGATQSQSPSPLPQEGAGKEVSNVQIVNGFWQFMPSKSTVFFQRAYFVNYPRPLFKGGFAPWPVPVPIVKFVVPPTQGIIFNFFRYRAFQGSGIGADDMVEIDPGRVVSVFGFQTQIGNRGVSDFNTNITTRGTPLLFGGGNVNNAVQPPVPGQGSFYPFAGDQEAGLRNFATYAQPGQEVSATVVVLRSPPMDVKMFSVEMAGYLVNQTQLFKILERISG